jgi:hypothetical protein
MFFLRRRPARVRDSFGDCGRRGRTPDTPDTPISVRRMTMLQVVRDGRGPTPSLLTPPILSRTRCRQPPTDDLVQPVDSSTIADRMIVPVV